MTPEQFKYWRKAMGWTQAQAAAELGIGKSTLELYEFGQRRDNGLPVEIPRTVELACAALAMIVEKIEIPVYYWPDNTYTTTGTPSDGSQLLGDILAPRGTMITTDDLGKAALAVPGLPQLVPLSGAINRGQTSIWMLGWKPFPP